MTALRIFCGFVILGLVVARFEDRSAVPIEDLLRMSGQDVAEFVRDESSHTPDDIEIDRIDPIIPPQTLQRPPHYPSAPLNNFLTYMRRLMHCGIKGWCGNRCCSDRRYRPSAYPQTINSPNRSPFGIVPPMNYRRKCVSVCEPYCTSSCLQYAYQRALEASPRRPRPLPPSMPPMHSPRMTLPSKNVSIPLCRPECMPDCENECIKRKFTEIMPVTCRPAKNLDCLYAQMRSNMCGQSSLNGSL
ncbi:hypothetical protein L596_016818 [Steinernema carpocapsae]|uniref:Domain of unknown function DB domain-containing protein n=1 Tax=Steinernema carpocapsae TaxID=34508 RepID=A0A4U5NJ41_STECR|nr:hypothetical protein L596_016818 [Steinernema carpocapsae]